MNQETKRKREKIIENDILERPINGRGMKGRKKGRKIGPCCGREPVRVDQYR